MDVITVLPADIRTLMKITWFYGKVLQEASRNNRYSIELQSYGIIKQII